MPNVSLKNAMETIANTLNNSMDAKIDVNEVAAKVDQVANLQTNAGVGEIMSTANTGYGAEIARTVTYSDQVYDFAVTSRNSLLSMLPASH
jgi:hypothetical protein